ncbi:hypothetical protein GCM10011571_26640 [Marinithermofilum abyssi]|uniref:YkoP-like domain-containing protein n=1 Tax=Marinithermofilum abyssi TaxID=1571185 RepID=A0A8J2VHK2_9BACL|nr:hypothetical protein [Marinithermofilum abyssi]GGE23221.1 hypothetical protein GCM10011571_26640 [Marinithermofilum abyssi]
MSTGLLTAWGIWDRIYYRLSRLQYVDKQSGNLFRVVVKRYSGEPLPGIEGVLLKKGDLYAKLHLHNYRIARILEETVRKDPQSSETKWALIILNLVRQSVPALADYVARHPRVGEIQALVGTTFLHRGAERFGFQLADLPDSWYARFKTQFFKVIVYCCHPKGWQRLRLQGHHLTPKRVYISKEQLLQRYQTVNGNGTNMDYD